MGLTFFRQIKITFLSPFYFSSFTSSRGKNFVKQFFFSNKSRELKILEDCPCFFFCSFWVVAMLFKAGSYFQLAFSLYGLTFFLYSRIILGIVLNGLFDVCFVFADHSVVIGADGLLGRGLCHFFSRTDEQRLLLLYWKRKKEANQ